MFAHGIDTWQHKSVEDYIQKLVPKLGDREWRLAFHSYPPDLGSSQFSANDWPIISFGNIGVLAGWLCQHYNGQCYTVHRTDQIQIGCTTQEISFDPEHPDKPVTHNDFTHPFALTLTAALFVLFMSIWCFRPSSKVK